MSFLPQNNGKTAIFPVQQGINRAGMARSSTTWKPGQSGNYKGCPKKTDTFSYIFEQRLAKKKAAIPKPNGKKEKVSGKVLIFEIIYSMATDKSMPPQVRLKAIEMMMERIGGRPLQEIEMTADVSSTITGRTGDIKASLDKLTPEEREMYFELCGKADDSDSEQ